jgi:hypothetical protein
MSTIRFTTMKLCILPTECVYVFLMILEIAIISLNRIKGLV